MVEKRSKEVTHLWIGCIEMNLQMVVKNGFFSSGKGSHLHAHLTECGYPRIQIFLCIAELVIYSLQSCKIVQKQ